MSDSGITMEYILVEKPPEVDANGVPIVKPDPVSQIIDILVKQIIMEESEKTTKRHERKMQTEKDSGQDLFQDWW